MDTQLRETLKNKKRVIVKIGSSSLLHEETGKLNLLKLERLVRIRAWMYVWSAPGLSQ